MTRLNHPLEPLLACVARGRLNLPNNLDHLWLAVGQDPFGDAERALDGYLDDPAVDEAVKSHILASLAAIDTNGPAV